MSNKFNWHGSEILKKAQEAAEKALKDAAEHILEDANRRVPHNEGTLQSSGITSFDKGAMKSVISYNTPYAVRVHEHPEWNYRNGREGKWLENSIQARKQDVTKYIQDKLKGELG